MTGRHSEERDMTTKGTQPVVEPADPPESYWGAPQTVSGDLSGLAEDAQDVADALEALADPSPWIPHEDMLAKYADDLTLPFDDATALWDFRPFLRPYLDVELPEDDQ